LSKVRVSRAAAAARDVVQRGEGVRRNDVNVKFVAARGKVEVRPPHLAAIHSPTAAALTKVTVAGKLSVTDKPVAVEGPKLVTEMV